MLAVYTYIQLKCNLRQKIIIMIFVGVFYIQESVYTMQIRIVI